MKFVREKLRPNQTPKSSSLSSASARAAVRRRARTNIFMNTDRQISRRTQEHDLPPPPYDFCFNPLYNLPLLALTFTSALKLATFGEKTSDKFWIHHCIPIRLMLTYAERIRYYDVQDTILLLQVDYNPRVRQMRNQAVGIPYNVVSAAVDCDIQDDARRSRTRCCVHRLIHSHVGGGCGDRQIGQ